MLVFGALPYGLAFTLTLYAQQVLGYSAVRFGLTSLVFPAMAAVGSILGQGIVLRVGFRPVAALGMALMGGGALLLTQVSVGGSYFGDIFFGLLVFGPGVGLAFVTASIAALAGVPEHESGLASGLSNTAFQIGAALGVAIVTTVAVTRTDDFLAANPNANPLLAPDRRVPVGLPRHRDPRRRSASRSPSSSSARHAPCARSSSSPRRHRRATETQRDETQEN